MLNASKQLKRANKLQVQTIGEKKTLVFQFQDT